jgi:hypothetical protein
VAEGGDGQQAGIVPLAEEQEEDGGLAGKARLDPDGSLTLGALVTSDRGG